MFADLGKIIKLAGQMKAGMAEVQDKLAGSQYTASAGGGAVSATVNGKGELLDIEFSDEALADSDLTADGRMLADIVKAAVAAAQQQAAAAAAEAMKELTGGVDFPGLSSMLGM